MRTVLADSSGLYALADANDANHALAGEFYRVGDCRLLLSNYLFAESMSLMTKRLGKSVALRWGNAYKASPRFALLGLEPEAEERAWTLFSARYRDKDFDLVDCASFAVMDAMGIREAFTFDRHFRQAGYRMVPGP